MKMISKVLGALAAAALLLAGVTPAFAYGLPVPIADAKTGCQVGNTGCALRVAKEAYAKDAIPETAASGNVAAATAAATLATASGVTTYISGFDFYSSGATAASVVNCTVTGVVTGTLTFPIAVTAGATLANAPISVRFDPPLPASAVNTTIVASCPSLGSGNTNAAMNAYGFKQ